jgi:hypothetical protein
MSRKIAVRVEPEQVEGVVEALLTVYAARAEALAHAAVAYVDASEGVDGVEDAGRALGEAGAALDGLGWRLGPRTAGGELTGPAGLVGDVLHAALLDGAEAVADACRRYVAAEVGLADLRRAVDDLAARHALFAAHEEREAL